MITKECHVIQQKSAWSVLRSFELFATLTDAFGLRALRWFSAESAAMMR
ncbi:hypothetical protein H8E77_03575 [bacterium]|nr:hypothetical protein [bacterium]